MANLQTANQQLQAAHQNLHHTNQRLQRSQEELELHNAERQRANQALLAAHDDLCQSNDRLSQSQEALQAQIGERQRANDELRAAHEELSRIHQALQASQAEIESRVLERTRELTAVNQTLRQSEMRVRTILETIEDGYYEVDLEGSIVFANEALGRIFGYSLTDLIGLPYRQYVNNKTVSRAFNEVYRTSKANLNFGYSIVRPDGGKHSLQE